MDSLTGLFTRLLLWLAGFTAIIAAILYFFFVRIATISEDNMAPTMLAGERIVLWRDATLSLSDIAVCRHPGADQYVIGRVVATAGSTIGSGRSGQYQVDGEPAEASSEGTINYIDQHSGHQVPAVWGLIRYGGHEHMWMMKARDRFRVSPVTVRSGIYLLSDNRSYHGADSRTFGEVDPSTCLGQVFFRLQPSHPPREDIVHGWMQIVK